MPLQPGDRIERYVIDAPLGQGGMGEVYRAHDSRLQRSVALKVLAASTGETAPTPGRPTSEGATRMLREARSAAALEHPNVVAIYDVGEVNEPESLRGTMFIAMELIKGKTLRESILDARVTLATKLRWLADVARALAAAHDKGLVHRDVKPENVMIRDDGVVKVLDFGIAKKTGTHVDPTSSTERFVVPTTAEGTLIGTPMYMAPEQLRGEPLDGRTDQFAWGVMAYEMLTGRLPWSVDGGAIMLVSQILSAQPASLEEKAGIPANVADLVMRALAKERDSRFPTMGALLEALEVPASSSQAKSVAMPLAFTPASKVRLADLAPETPAVPRADGRTTEPSRVPREPPGRRRWVLAACVIVILVAAAVIGRRIAQQKGATVMVAAVDASPVGGCTSNRACSAENGGKAYVCRASDHTCVAVDSEDCKASYEPRDLERDDTVWLGAMTPLKGPQAERFGTMTMDGADFARSELALAMTPLENPATPGHARPVALVECDDSENAERAAHHLVDDVGVPGILGFRSGDEVLSLAGSLLIPRHVVSVASLTPNPLVTRLAQPANAPRLVWRTTYSFDDLAEATAAVVPGVLEPRKNHRGETHVVLVRNGDVPAGGFAETFYRSLSFNGKSALENRRAYQEIVLRPKEESALDADADQIAAAEPSIVVFMIKGSPLELTRLIEARAKRHPIYLLPNLDAASLAPFIEASVERRRRVFAIASLSNSMPNARFVIRYNQQRQAKVTRVFNPSTTYDAFYALAYACFAVPPDARVDGLALADRFSRLVGPGKTIEVGPSGVLDALTILSSGGTINLDGAAGPLDFDLSTGETSVDFALSCPEVDTRGVADGDVESGVVYRSKLHRLEGTLVCP